MLRNGQLIRCGKIDETLTANALTELYDVPVSVVSLGGKNRLHRIVSQLIET